MADWKVMERPLFVAAAPGGFARNPRKARHDSVRLGKPMSRYVNGMSLSRSYSTGSSCRIHGTLAGASDQLEASGIPVRSGDVDDRRVS